MKFVLATIGAFALGIPLYVASTTLLGIVGKEPWMSICLFVSLIIAGIVSYWVIQRIAKKNKSAVNMMSNGVRKTFGVLAMFIGLSILVWCIYNLFSPTPEFKSATKTFFSFGVPLTMIYVGWAWFTGRNL
jgi:uncharacterized protein YjeT (DUF2065 family)